MIATGRASHFQNPASYKDPLSKFMLDRILSIVWPDSSAHPAEPARQIGQLNSIGITTAPYFRIKSLVNLEQIKRDHQ